MSPEESNIERLLEGFLQAQAGKTHGFRLSDSAREEVLRTVRARGAAKPTLTVDQLLESIANPAQPAPPLSEFSRNQILASVRRGAAAREKKASSTAGWRRWMRPIFFAPALMTLLLGILYLNTRPDPIQRRLTLAALAVRGGNTPLEAFSNAASLVVDPSLSSVELIGEGGLKLTGTLSGGRLETVEGETLAVFELRVSGTLDSKKTGSLSGRLVWELSTTSSSIESVVRDPASRLRFSGEWVGVDGRRQPVEFR
jgi:hypothetical protein